MALSGMLVALLGPAITLSADHTHASEPDPLDTIIVPGNRIPDAVADEQLRVEVKTVLHDDPYLYDGHVTVTVKDGVVRLEGAVLDYGDIGSVLRIIRKKFPRVKRVVNELEVIREDTDDG
jgi:BON domain-containing protein